MYEGIFHLHDVLEPLVFYLAIIAFSAQDVDHNGRKDHARISKGKVEHNSQKHIKLRAIMRLYRMMATVMDPGCRFIDIYFAGFICKHFDRKNTRRVKA